MNKFGGIVNEAVQIVNEAASKININLKLVFFDILQLTHYFYQLNNAKWQVKQNKFLTKCHILAQSLRRI